MKGKTKKVPEPWVSLEDRENKSLSKAGKRAKVRYHAEKLRELGIPVDIKKRTFQVPFTSLAEAPVPHRFYIRKLLRLGFIKQFTIF